MNDSAFGHDIGGIPEKSRPHVDGPTETPNILYCLLAGGRGERLKPYTDTCPKPLLRFGSSGRIIDFTLYNCLTSGAGNCVVLAQYLDSVLERYVTDNWRAAYEAAGKRVSVASSRRMPGGCFNSTADAVFQTVNGLSRLPNYLVVLAGDHVYRMDYRPMIEYHITHGASTTVGAVECHRRDAHRFGIINSGDNGTVTDFHEKPNTLGDILPPRVKPLASMGIYVFTTEPLMAYLADQRDDPALDFGRDVIPQMLKNADVRAYRFSVGDGRPAYWRDIGEPKAFLRANMDILTRKRWRNELRFDPLPLVEHDPFPPDRLVEQYDDGQRRIRNSFIAESAEIGHAVVEDSILGPGAQVEDGAWVKHSLVLDGAVITNGERIVGRIVDNPRIMKKPLLTMLPGRTDRFVPAHRKPVHSSDHTIGCVL